jgi:hypothetical protein
MATRAPVYDATPLDVLLASVPSLPRAVLSRLTARMIDRMDEPDADTCLEERRSAWAADVDLGEPAPLRPKPDLSHRAQPIGPINAGVPPTTQRPTALRGGFHWRAEVYSVEGNIRVRSG